MNISRRLLKITTISLTPILTWTPTETVLHPLHLAEHSDHALLRRHAHAVQQLHALPQELGRGHGQCFTFSHYTAHNSYYTTDNSHYTSHTTYLTLHISHYTAHSSHYTNHNSTPCWWRPPAPACPRSATRAPRRSSPCRRGRSGAVKIITIFGEGFFRTWIWCNFRKISLTALNNTMENLSGYLYLIVVLLPLEQLITNCG